MNIVFGIDDAYVGHLAVCLNSLFQANQGCKFRIFILCLNVTQSNRKKLTDWVKANGYECCALDVSSDISQSFPLYGHDYLSLAAYLRLFMTKYLPGTVHKALYLDTDIIVRGSIKELYETEFSAYALEAVEDAPNNNPKRLLYPAEERYFNSGMMMLNVDYLREIDFYAKAVAYLKEHSDLIVLHDQDVLNALLHGHVKFLPHKWNMLDCFFFKKPFIQSEYLKNLPLYQRSAPLIHFSGPIKPWHYFCRHPLKRLYLQFAKGLPFDIWGDRWYGLRKFPAEDRYLLCMGIHHENLNEWRKHSFLMSLIRRIERIRKLVCKIT